MHAFATCSFLLVPAHPKQTFSHTHPRDPSPRISSADLESLAVEDYLRVRSPSKNRRHRKIVRMTLHSNQSSQFVSTTRENRVEESGQSNGGWKSNDGRLSCGFSSIQGRRSTMEDFYDIKALKISAEAVYLFGIFDGHGGSHAAEYLKERLFDNLMNHPKFMEDTIFAIRETYKRTDTDFLEAEINAQRDDGSTASTAILIGNHLYIANVGDSRAVISKAGEAVQLSEDHKPNRTDERKRIENAGGVVMWAGTWRVGGILAMSRAFGDRLLKQFVVPDPEIRVETVDEALEYLVLASDGLWDSLTNQEAVALVTSECEPMDAARKLTETAFARGSGDNITCIVVKFHHNDPTAATTQADSAGCSDPRSSATTADFSRERTTVDSSASVTAEVSPPTSVAGSSSAGSLDPLLDMVAVGLPAKDHPSAGTAAFPPSTSAAGSLADSGDPHLDAIFPTPGGSENSPLDATAGSLVDTPPALQEGHPLEGK